MTGEEHEISLGRKICDDFLVINQLLRMWVVVNADTYSARDGGKGVEKRYMCLLCPITQF